MKGFPGHRPDGLDASAALEVARLDLNGRIASLPPGLATLPNLLFVGVYGTALCDGTTLSPGALDPALDALAAAGVISCCMPEFPFWPCDS